MFLLPYIATVDIAPPRQYSTTYSMVARPVGHLRQISLLPFSATHHQYVDALGMWSSEVNMFQHQCFGTGGCVQCSTSLEPAPVSGQSDGCHGYWHSGSLHQIPQY